MGTSSKDDAPRAPASARRSRQVNLALTAAQEELVRLLVLRLREGGLEFERRVREFVQEAPVPRYMHVDELDRRFGALERRIMVLEQELDGRAGSDSDG